MTTIVTVVAHCDDKTQVRVQIDNATTGDNVVLQNGESFTGNVWGNRTISISEEPKEKSK